MNSCPRRPGSMSTTEELHFQLDGIWKLLIDARITSSLFGKFSQAPGMCNKVDIKEVPLLGTCTNSIGILPLNDGSTCEATARLR
mmetsp:Transcript_51211/g.109684  ORF Transcript_51211/g.109684 Transcript_51211/m.109684 type:complete len:85 (+) Transcript_51211:635-889(+)